MTKMKNCVLCGVVVHQIENVDRQTKKAQERSKKRDKDNEATVQTKDTKNIGSIGNILRVTYLRSWFTLVLFSFLVASFMLR